jgi:deaminated glutathione amidase
MTQLTAACLQMCSSKVMEENINKACNLIEQAADSGAQLIVTPEMTTLLDKTPEQQFAKSFSQDDDPALPIFQQLAAKRSVTLIIGSLPIHISDRKCANRCFVIGPSGDLVASYDKIHLFDVALGKGNQFRESKDYIAGKQAVVTSAAGTSIGLSICYDLRFPQLYQDLAIAGAQVLTVPAAFTRVTGEAHWHTLIRARAIETGCFVLASAQGGKHADGRETYGHSMIVNPWGEILAELESEPGIITATLNLAEVAEARKRVPCLSNKINYQAPSTP